VCDGLSQLGGQSCELVGGVSGLTDSGGGVFGFLRYGGDLSADVPGAGGGLADVAAHFGSGRGLFLYGGGDRALVVADVLEVLLISVVAATAALVSVWIASTSREMFRWLSRSPGPGL
jgi:hypothetical protein